MMRRIRTSRLLIAILLCLFVSMTAWADVIQMPTSTAKIAYRGEAGATARTRNFGAARNLNLGYTDALYGGMIVQWDDMLDSLNARCPAGFTVDSVIDSCLVGGNQPSPDDTCVWKYFPINAGYTWNEGTDSAVTQTDSCSWNYRKHDTADWTGAIGTVELDSADTSIGNTLRDPGWCEMRVTNTDYADSIVRYWEGIIWQIDTVQPVSGSTVDMLSDDDPTNPYRRYIYYTPTPLEVKLGSGGLGVGHIGAGP